MSKKEVKVISEYFRNIEMDDSSSDFLEKKKCYAGPKTVKKAKVNKPRKLKRAKGQKDIRALIKKDDLVSYSKNFEQVCKKSGVDVDSEQLQIAIALSKSLHETGIKTEDFLQDTKPLTSQERTAKIRTTLQEYGFRVPSTKITKDTNRRKNLRKKYKLLILPHEEKQQNISDKYAEVLVRNINKSPKKIKVLNLDNANDKEFYYKATSILYEYMKNDDIFYVKDLFNKPLLKTCLLKDWAAIPGRPASPKSEQNHINFDDIECSQTELDFILSGSVVAAQNIVKNKLLTNKNIENFKYKNPEEIMKGNNSTVICRINEFDNSVQSSDGENEFKKEINSKTLTLSVSQVRSVSPDIFDDDVSTILDHTSIPVQNSQKSVCNSLNNFMDLTECVNNVTNNLIKNELFSINEINRKSNDIMELTECISTTSKLFHINNINFNLNCDKPTKETETETNGKENLVLDLTQSSNSDCDLPLVEIGNINEDSIDKTLLLCEDVKSNPDLFINSVPLNSKTDPDLAYGYVHNLEDLNEVKSGNTEVYNSISCKDSEHVCNDNNNENNFIKANNDKFLINGNLDMSPTLSSHSNDDNSLVKGDMKKEKSLDETIIITEEVESNPVPNSLEKCEQVSSDYRHNKLEELDKLESNNENFSDHSFVDVYNDYYDYDCYNDYGEEINNEFESNKEEENKSFDKNIDNKSPLYSNIEITNQKSIELVNDDDIHSVNISNKDVEDENHDDDVNIDLTQNSNSSHKTREKELNQNACNNNSFGKINNISIDYDDLFDEVMSEASKCVSQTSFKSIASVDKEVCSSNNSDGFEISDQEFNYSLHKSRHNFDIGGISVLDNISDLKQSIRKSCRTTLNRSSSVVDFFSAKKNKTSESKAIGKSQFISQSSTPVLSQDVIKGVQENSKNSEYIIKTKDVTPMRDYASMTSPERNKELEKYGLKPFKRKRAIQLLTHLYNETHPMVESCVAEEYSSPSKKRKYDDEAKNSSPAKSKMSPRKQLFSNSIPEVNKENSLYLVTKENPDIREINCDPEDWVFQKREKAKVRSCKVPLHIAFHNYVSCRQLLREAILRYEPINIDVIHKDLVASGYRYNPKDLLKFMDKKCITVKTVDNNAKNKI